MVNGFDFGLVSVIDSLPYRDHCIGFCLLFAGIASASAHSRGVDHPYDVALHTMASRPLFLVVVILDNLETSNISIIQGGFQLHSIVYPAANHGNLERMMRLDNSLLRASYRHTSWDRAQKQAEPDVFDSYCFVILGCCKISCRLLWRGM